MAKVLSLTAAITLLIPHFFSLQSAHFSKKFKLTQDRRAIGPSMILNMADNFIFSGAWAKK